VWRCSIARRNISDPDFTVLVLESNSDSHLSEEEDISAQSDSDTDSDTNCTHWTDNTNCQPTAPAIHRCTQGPSGVQQTEPPLINNTLPHLAF